MGKKGFTPADYQLSFLLEVIVLFIFIFFLWKAIGALLNPDIQTAVLNTERLRAKINEACFNPGQIVTLDGFRLTQPKPNKLAGFTDALPRFNIISGGDPNFVLYYEAFPVGEAIAWEVYEDFGTRVIAPYKHQSSEDTGDTIDKNDFTNKLLNQHLPKIENGIKQFFEGSYAAQNPLVVNAEKNIAVNNILLQDSLGPIPAGIIAYKKLKIDSGVIETGQDEERMIGPINFDENPLGKWVNDNQYAFSSYRGLSEFEQSFIKYRPCEDNALCLKTRSSVYTFPLDPACADADYIQLAYDAREVELEQFLPAGAVAALARTWPRLILTRLGIVGGTIAAFLAARETVGFALRYKVSDFYLASPCGIEKMEITRLDSCNDQNNNYPCEKMVKYPLYEYSDPVLKKGEHYTCIDNLGDDFDIKNDAQPNEFMEYPSSCIRIKVEVQPTDYCFTRNPQVTHVYDGGSWIPVWMQQIKNWFTLDALTKVFDGLGGLPVKGTTIFFATGLPKTDAVIIKPESISSTILSLNSEAFEKAWNWGWP